MPVVFHVYDLDRRLCDKRNWWDLYYFSLSLAQCRNPQYAFGMIHGGMDVIQEHQAEGSPPVYRVLFYPYPTRQRPPVHGAIRQQMVIQGHELRDFFMLQLLNESIALETREAMANEWIATLQREGQICLRPVEISEELFDRLTVP